MPANGKRLYGHIVRFKDKYRVSLRLLFALSYIISTEYIYIYAVKEAAALAVDFYMIAALLCLGVFAVDYASIIFLIKLQAQCIDNL